MNFYVIYSSTNRHVYMYSVKTQIWTAEDVESAKCALVNQQQPTLRIILQSTFHYDVIFSTRMHYAYISSPLVLYVHVRTLIGIDAFAYGNTRVRKPMRQPEQPENLPQTLAFHCLTHFVPIQVTKRWWWMLAVHEMLCVRRLISIQLCL